MDDTKIKVRILPLKGIGGVGNAGDVVTMSAADAEMYVRDGYVEVVEDATPSDLRTSSPNLESANLEESHEIMKPQAKRAKRK
jgi:hypothetical protein